MARLPVSTYRLQLNRGLPLPRAAELVDYLDALGVSHVYASPVCAARAGSPHGYDVIDPTRVNPELGTEGDLGRLVRRLRARGMGLVLDIVPNHMCVSDPGNPWWWDVLENGPASRYARYFDVEWDSPEAGLRGRILLPILGAPLREVLRRGEIRLACGAGALWAGYGAHRLPLEPRSWRRILRPALDRLPRASGERRGLARILEALEDLPDFRDARPAAAGRRRARIPALKRRLAALARASRAFARAVERAAGAIGADPRALGRLLEAQPYRPAFWREAARRINYRRFFEINELAGLRVEDPEVFAAVHALALRLVRRGWADGLRIDHIDGLADPQKYLHDLGRSCREAAGAGPGEGRPRFYCIVEKILCGEEELPARWPVDGTTGYEFLNLLGGLFVDPGGAAALRRLYARFAGRERSFPDVVYESKKRVLEASFAAELSRLARLLAELRGAAGRRPAARPDRWRGALAELIACFPVYRTYLRGAAVPPRERRRIEAALGEARRRNPGRGRAALAFVREALLRPEAFAGGREKALRREFVARFQQLTGPAMAKGFEDTALYRWFPLASLNEVGGEPDALGVAVERFHEENRRRLRRWAGALNATSTHDTKRSEDVRARLSVLSEMPGEWEEAVLRWRRMNRPHRRGRRAIGPNDEYLLYQTLAGAWPPRTGRGFPDGAFTERIRAYMVKAAREAKRRTSWSRPDPAYEEALAGFVETLLNRRVSGGFLADFRRFAGRLLLPGLLNSLSQALLKIASPGVPDFYQGCETLNFSLVDPDNRRPVDFEGLRAALAALRPRGPGGLPRLLEELARRPGDGRAKLWVVARALRFRRANPALFAEGGYLPLPVLGGRAECVVAFARRGEGGTAIAAAGRFFGRLGAAGRNPVGGRVWGDTALALGRSLAPGRYRDVLTSREVVTRRTGGGWTLPLGEVFSWLPVALLERDA